MVLKCLKQYNNTDNNNNKKITTMLITHFCLFRSVCCITSNVNKEYIYLFILPMKGCSQMSKIIPFYCIHFLWGVCMYVHACIYLLIYSYFY